jgi:hypothetical protein
MKCFHCKKKTHLEFKCSCEKVFCVACRMPEIHVCPAFKVEPVVLVKVVAPKVDRL